MTHPKASPGKQMLLSAILGRDDIPDNTPRWMDRRYGYTAKKGRSRNTHKQQKKRK
jgi:hypothetical protein